MRRSYRLLVPASLALFGLTACSDPNGVAGPTIPKPDAVLGQLAFQQSCASCHASGDGFDIKSFGFSDTTIIRRAVKHVDSTTARNIVAYINGLNAPHNDVGLQLFQPKGMTLSSDVDFATALFGRDAWPSDLTTAQLLAIDPRNVAIALKLPVWADENSNMDWMPDFALPNGILDYSGGLARAAIAGYNAAPTAENLVRAVNALRTADRATANPEAPCLLEDLQRVRYLECFEVRRWTSTLVAMFALRNGMNAQVANTVHDVWWDVGNAARKSRADPSLPIANSDQNWARWMFLGWSFDPSLHSSTYTGGGFKQVGLLRHATFVALRSQVARPPNAGNGVYEDLLNAVKFAPTSWTVSVTTFGLRHLDEREKAGDRPATADLRTTAISSVSSALTEAGKKVSAAEKAQLDALAKPVLAGLK
jgi:hypothetical protein